MSQLIHFWHQILLKIPILEKMAKKTSEIGQKSSKGTNSGTPFFVFDKN